MTWTTPTPADRRIYAGDPLADIIATRRTGTDLLLVWCTWQDGLNLAITLERDGRAIASTDNAADWPIIEQVLPRAEWPAEVGPDQGQNCAPALRQMIDAYIAANQPDDEEDE